MSDFHDYDEPIPDHLADTGPIRPIRVDEPLPAWRRAVGLLSLLGTAALTLATTFMVLTPPNTPEVVPPVQDAVENTPIPTTLPTQQAVDNLVVLTSNTNTLPTIAPEMMVSLLATPVVPADNVITAEVVRDFYNPFTIIPDRPRSEVIQYEVVAGDTIYSIAERFGLRPESIAWANDRALALALRPGNRLNILPVDGVFVAAIGSKTIADLAAEYQVDPYAIIDSEFNDLFDATPDTVLPSGTQIVIPGGQAEQISWNPIVERTGGDGGGGSGSGGVGTISFAPGDPGSCGAVENSGGGSFWQRPIANYTFIRGFSSWHTGVDLASSVGTPVFAANTGRVIFAGWNSWGYGYTVVLAHGPYTTLYGHLDSYNVSCGQLINAGDFVATVGSSGNSSGPHLHFEIRYLDTPTNPVSTIGF